MFVVIAPAGVRTGGVECLHQAVHAINSIAPGRAALCRYPFDAPPADEYPEYGNPIVQKERIPRRATILLPEIWPELARQFTQPCGLWWLSVDNFGSHGQTDLSAIRFHLCQSEYARRHVLALGATPQMLTDYVHPDFAEAPGTPRVAAIIVNPAKGVDLIDAFAQRHPEIPIRRLGGLDRAGVRALLQSSEAYVDFGHQPGRDRPPREAAACGCVVLFARRGAAANSIDAPIAERFKFGTIEQAGAAVRAVLADPERCRAQQAGYRRVIAGQRGAFLAEVRALLQAFG